MPALAPVESSELDIAPGLPGEIEVDGGVGSTVVGITEVADEVIIGGEDDAGTEVVMEIVKLVGVALPSVCVVMVEISVVVIRMELRVAEEIVTVVGGSTETTVVVTDEGASVDFEVFLPPSSLLSSEQIRPQNLSSKDFEKKNVLFLFLSPSPPFPLSLSPPWSLALSPLLPPLCPFPLPPFPLLLPLSSRSSTAGKSSWISSEATRYCGPSRGSVFRVIQSCNQPIASVSR